MLLATLFAALVLTIVPLPETLAIGRPAFVAAVTAFWVLHRPTRFGLLAAGMIGLCLDVITPSLLGQHALALGLLAYLVLTLRDTLQMFPSWQQAVVLLPVWAAYELCLFGIDLWAGHDIAPIWRWAPVLSTALLWPLLGLFAGAGRAPRRQLA